MKPLVARWRRRFWQTDQERFDLYMIRVGRSGPPRTALRTSTIISVLDLLPWNLCFGEDVEKMSEDRPSLESDENADKAPGMFQT
jgi:hypothetical protein